ncbi:hypothetical protein Tco_1435939, partial [Tanacetum coccineum]
THDDEASSSRPKRTNVTETVDEAVLGIIHHEFLLWNNFIEEMLEIKIVKMGGQEEIFTSKAWRHAFNISEPIYTKLCHEYFATYEFDGEVTDEELISKKLIKFRLGGHGHSLSLLEFARHLGLYNSAKIHEEGFKVSISSADQLSLSRSLTKTIRNPIRRFLQKMITYGLCQGMTAYDKIQQNELWLISMFENRHQQGLAKKMQLLTNEILDGLSAPIYYRYLDAITLRELIGPNGRLIIEDPALGGVLERMSRRQLYHIDRYAGVFEFIAGHYGVPLNEAYVPPGYDEQQHQQEE